MVCARGRAAGNCPAVWGPRPRQVPPMNAFDTLKARGFFYQLTDEPAIRDRLFAARVTFYVGFDPTADSLHVGHLLPVMAMRFLQQGGHRPIAIVGGGTAMVGDPSGKTEARQILTREQIAANAAGLKRQLSRFLRFDSGDGALLLDNADWLMKLGYIEFLRDVGVHFSVNQMLAAESVKLRLAQEQGLSFLEFNYMLLQAYDFYVLARDHQCELQLGGQDQWGNIVAGTGLVRRLLGRPGFGGTFPLLTNSAGAKFGKSVAGAVWLDAARTPVFDYYQFWRNVEDTDVGRLLLLFTALPVEECQRLGALPAPAINRAKEVLAFEATTLAHGEAAAAEAFLAAGRQFGFADAGGVIATTSAITDVKADTAAALPTVTLAPADLAGEGVGVCKLLVQTGMAASNGAARRLVEGGGVYVNDARVSDLNLKLTAAAFRDGALLLRTGKKTIKRVVLAN